jgi:inhibitor of cysteine peptidase
MKYTLTNLPLLVLSALISTVALFMLAVPYVFANCTAESMAGTWFGGKGPQVSALQNCLIGAGYNIPAGATGYYGEQTRSAVRTFYADALGMPEWHGNSVGPLGRSALVARVSTPSQVQAPMGGALRAVKGADELAQYLQAPREYGGFGLSSRTFGTGAPTALPMAMADASMENSTPSRVSDTNVQVAGIDEPDIVKTDGEHLYVSTPYSGPWFFDGPVMPAVMSDEVTDIGVRSTIAPAPGYPQSSPTKIVDAFPPADMKVVSKAIEENGEMLLVRDKKVLIVFSQPNVVAYDVTNSAKPRNIWTYALTDNTSVVTARLHDGEVYLVTQTYLDSARPCPVVPMQRGGVDISIACGSVLVPEQIEPVSHLYTALAIEPVSGSVLRKTSFAVEAGVTNVYMSESALYIASETASAQYRILATLMVDSMVPYLSASTIARARTILDYDISDLGKLQEVERVFQAELALKDSDERLRIENEASNSFQDALQKRARDMYRTRIVRMSLDTLGVSATGEVPGTLLNQFAMDEYAGNLRVAVTVGTPWGQVESMNDVYVLDAQLRTVGSVTDLGLGERVYSVRFMGDVGYLVTFRQIDPFYVLDLSVPTAPKVTGELKIPGYSAYLEYVGDDMVLGVGREGSGVKLSLFDVQDPANPIEKAKYQLKDSWTEVEGNHHAFLRDAENELLFIPGGNGGYIFSYANGTLSLVHAVSGHSVRRAVYMDDYFYVVSDEKILVYRIGEWDLLKSLAL